MMATSRDECVIRDVKLRKNDIGPVLVDFEHGCLKKGEGKNLNCGVYTNPNSSKSKTVAAVADGGDVVYQGNIHQDEDDICRTFLAVRNKRNNKMRIYETSQVTLSPVIASNETFYLNTEDRKEAYFNLSHAFGSKKNKRVADQKARMEVNVDAVKDKLSTTVRDVEITEDVKLTTEDDSLSKLLPPCNREANTPADVYPISSILKKREISSLEEFYLNKSGLAKLTKEMKMSPYYKLMEKKIMEDNSMHGALLLYVESLIQFCNMHPKQITHKTNFCPFSDLAHKRIVKDFTTTDGLSMTRSKFLTDKTVVYIIILSLHIGGFHTDLHVLAESILFMDIMRIRTLARAIGTIPSKTSKSDVILKVPLPPQQSLVVKGRKSKKNR